MFRPDSPDQSGCLIHLECKLKQANDLAVSTIIVVQRSAFEKGTHGEGKRWFEQTLVSIRFLALLAVIASLIGCPGMFYISTVDLWNFSSKWLVTSMPFLSRASRGARATTIYMSLSWWMGTCWLDDAHLCHRHLSAICVPDRSHQIVDESGAVWVVNSLDDLKARLGKVVIIILIVEFFEQTMGMDIATLLDALYTAGAIALIGLALYLSHAR